MFKYYSGFAVMHIIMAINIMVIRFFEKHDIQPDRELDQERDNLIHQMLLAHLAVAGI